MTPPEKRTDMKKHLLFLLPLCLICSSLSSQSWVVNYHGDYPSGRTHFSSGFIDLDGVTFLSGNAGPDNERPKALLMRIDPDGNHQEFIYHKDDYYSEATCILETDEHHLFVAGVLFNENDYYLLTLLLDKNLNLLKEQWYEKEVEATSFGSCKAVSDSHGNIIVATTVNQPGDYGTIFEHGVFFKFDHHGNLISHRYLIADYPDPVYFLMYFRLKQMWYHEENETLLCLAWGNGNVNSFITFDSAFNYIYEYPIWRDHSEKSDHTLYNDCYTDFWYSDEEALFFGGKGDDEHNRLRISRVNTQGEFLQYKHLHERLDTIDSPAKQRCMATINDSTFYFSFYQHVESYYPGQACVYKLNKNMDIIGRYIDNTHRAFRTYLIFPTCDGGCITVNDSCNMETTTKFSHPVISKINKEDFETVTWSVCKSESKNTRLYPNPTNGILMISLDKALPYNTSCRICDQYGRTIIDREIFGDGDVLQLDITNLKAGIHVITIYTDNETLLSEKFIKQ